MPPRIVVADSSFIDALAKETAAHREGPARSALRSLGRTKVVVSVVTVAEFIRSREERSALEFLAAFAKAPATLETARIWAKVQARAPLGQNDAWIAATALHLGAPLLGRDGAYGRVPGLRYLAY